jgi:hypothetical protein
MWVKKKLPDDPTHTIHYFNYLFPSHYPASLTASWKRGFTYAGGSEIFHLHFKFVHSGTTKPWHRANIGSAETDTLIPG